LTLWMSTRGQLESLYEELAAPSAKVFLQALRARNIQVRAADVQAFISSKSERQIQQPGNKFSGKVVAFSRNDRWSADVISFVSNTAFKEGKRFAYVLIFQDMFSCKIWTVPMVSLAEVTESFERLVEDTAPRALVVDKGIEFRAAKFKAACVKFDVVLTYKDSNDRNGPTSRLDAAIAQLKRAMVRLQELDKGKNWLEVLDKATAAYNKSHHGSTDAPPNDMSDSIILEQKKENAVKAGHNDREIRARKAKLQKLGGFRVLNPKPRGLLRKRAGDEIWGRRIHQTTSFPIASRVVDEDGNEFATKLVLAVALDSSELKVKTNAEDELRPFAERMRELIPPGERAFSGPIQDELADDMPGLETLLRKYRLSTAAFLDKFPDLITRDGRRISAA